MKTTSLAILALLKGLANADVMMIKSFSGGKDHAFISDIHRVCQNDARLFCQDMHIMNDDFLGELMEDAALHEQFPLLRVVVPLGEADSLKLLNDLLPPPPPLPTMAMRVRIREPTDIDNDLDDVLNALMEDLMKSSIDISKVIAPPPEERVSITNKPNKNFFDGGDLSPPEDVAEKAFEVLVNSLLDHANSASASTDFISESEDSTDVIDPTLLSKKMVQIGKGIIEEKVEEESDEGNLRRRLARKLMEVTPSRGMPPLMNMNVIRIRSINLDEKVADNLPSLDFGPKIDKCLWDAYDQRRVSEPCGRALQNKLSDLLTSDRGRQNIIIDTSKFHEKPVQQKKQPCPHHQRKMFLRRLISNFLVSAILSFMIVTAIMYNRSNEISKIRQIVQAIDKDPELKTAVESAIDFELDDVVAPVCSKSDNSCVSFCDSCVSLLPLVGLILLLLFTAIISPRFVILIGAPILGLTTSYTVLRKLCFLDTATDEDEYEYVPLEGKEPGTKVFEAVPIQVV